MISATIREVQHNLASFLKRVEQGEEIEIRRRNKVVARLTHVGAYESGAKPLDWGVLRERRQTLWGGRRTPGKATSDIVSEARGDR